ncbi:MAG: DEAD/DEAH box helicase [Nanoarchaeota archaeon]
MEFLQNITPREYQLKILETCKEKNCLVVLPTGIGKTLIALMLTIERMKSFPNEKILFLAPTKPLVEQHLTYFTKHLPELFGDMNLFTGKINPTERKKLWDSSDIIFSTPQCIANDIKNNLYDLKQVSLLVEDEAHRCIKNYDYRYIAETYKSQAEHSRILGLTASPGSTKEKIKEICKNLSVEALELRTRESEDVSPFLQELKFKAEKIDFPPEFEEIRQLLKVPYNNYINELKNRHLLFDFPSKTNLIMLQKKLMNSVSRGNRNFNTLKGISVCSSAIKLQHALELLETQTLESFYSYMKELFEQSAKSKSSGIKILVKKPQFTLAYNKTIELIAKKIEHPKLDKIKQLILETYEKNPMAKSIIFSQYRNTASTIVKNLNTIEGIKAKVFIGQASKKGSIGLTQKEQKQIIEDFSNGEINVIACTSIGEEGLDIPEVNQVIFYEPVPSEIRKIQRAGRTARLFPGELTILITKKTRDEAFHWASFSRERKMHKTISNIQDEFSNKSENKQKTITDFKNNNEIK